MNKKSKMNKILKYFMLLSLFLLPILFTAVNIGKIQKNPEKVLTSGTLNLVGYPVILDQNTDGGALWIALKNHHLDNIRIAYYDGSWNLVPFQLDEMGYFRSYTYETGKTVSGTVDFSGGSQTTEQCNWGHFIPDHRYVGKHVDGAIGSEKELSNYTCVMEYWAAREAEVYDTWNSPVGDGAAQKDPQPVQPDPTKSPWLEEQPGNAKEQLPDRIDWDDELCFYSFNGDQVSSSIWWNAASYPYRYEIAITDPANPTEIGYMYLYYNDDTGTSPPAENYFIPTGGADLVNWDIATQTVIGQNYEFAYDSTGDQAYLADITVEGQNMFSEWNKEWQELMLDVQRAGASFGAGAINSQSHQDTARMGTWNGVFYDEIDSDIGYAVTMDFDLMNLGVGPGDTTFPGQDFDYNNGHRRYNQPLPDGQNHGTARDQYRELGMLFVYVTCAYDDYMDHDGDYGSSSEYCPFVRGLITLGNNHECAIDGPVRVVVDLFSLRQVQFPYQDEAGVNIMEYEEGLAFYRKTTLFYANEFKDINVDINLDYSPRGATDPNLDVYMHAYYMFNQGTRLHTDIRSDNPEVWLGQAPSGYGYIQCDSAYATTRVCVPDGSNGGEDYLVNDAGPVIGRYDESNPIVAATDNPLSDWRYVKTDTAGAWSYMPVQEMSAIFSGDTYSSVHWYWQDVAGFSEMSFYGNDGTVNAISDPLDCQRTYFDSGIMTDAECKEQYVFTKEGFGITCTYQIKPDLVPNIDFSADDLTPVTGQIVSFTSSGDLGDEPSTYAWDVDGDGITDYTTANPTHVYSTPGTYTVSLTVTDSDLDTDTETKTNYITVELDTQPEIDFSADVTLILEGESVSFTSSGTLGNVPSTYAWDVDGDGITDYTTANPTHTYSTSGTYTVSLTVTDDDGDSDVETKSGYITVELDTQPDIDFIADILNPVTDQTVSFTSSGTLGNIPVTYAWDVDGDGITDYATANPTHAYSSSGTYTVSLTVTDRDSDSDTETKSGYITVDLDTQPDIDFIADILNPVTDQTVSFTSSGILGNGPVAYAWDFDNDGIIDSDLANPTHIYSSSGTYTVSLTVTDRDSDSDIETKSSYITVDLDTQPDIDFSADETSILIGESVSFSVLGTLGNGPITYAWDVDGDGITDYVTANPTHTYNIEGNYTVSLTVTDRDSDSDTEIKIDYIVVGSNLVPNIDFIADNLNPVTGQTVSFTSSGSLGDTPSTYAWDVDGDGITDYDIANPTHVYSTPGTYTVSLTVTDSDLDTDTETKTGYITVDLDTQPDIDFIADILNPVTGQTVSFTSSGTLGNSPVTYAWDVDGDGITDYTTANPTHVYSTPGTYTVSLTVTDRDSDSDTETKSGYITVDLDTQPDIDFIADILNPVTGQTVSFTSSGTLGNSPATYAWDVDGDGITDYTTANPTHVYSSPGTYTVSLTVTDRDSDSDTETKSGYITVDLDTQPDIDFIADILNPVTGQTVSFTSSGTLGNSPVTYAWDVDGDGITDYTTANPTHVYSTPGTYTVSLTVTDRNSDSDTETKTGYITVVLTTVPDIDFIADILNPVTGQTVSFTSSGYLGDEPSTYAWDVDGDGITDYVVANPTHVYSTPGTYTVSLTVTDSDLDTDTETKTGYITVDLDTQPDIDFIADILNPVTGQTVTFTSTGTLGNSPVTYAWDFDSDGIIDSDLANPTHVYSTPGTYTVSLTVTDRNSDSDTETKSGYIIATAPPTPVKVQNVSVRQMTIGTGVYIEWVPNVEAVSYYNVYCNGEFIDSTTDTELYYMPLEGDIDPLLGTYQVAAVNEYGVEGPKSDPATVPYTPTDPTLADYINDFIYILSLVFGCGAALVIGIGVTGVVINRRRR